MKSLQEERFLEKVSMLIFVDANRSVCRSLGVDVSHFDFTPQTTESLWRESENLTELPGFNLK